jgi:hypothetical protein
MTFAGLSTLVLVGAALLTTAAVVVLHLLRRTPRPQVVSNVEFWRRAAERAQPRSPFATRVPWTALLVSLAIALLLVSEMGDPRWGAGPSGVTVLVLDADRSMNARDARGRRRLDDAIVVARDAVQRSTVYGTVAIVRAGVRNTVLSPLTRRAADAERALAHVEADDGTADLDAAVTAARTLARASGGGRVVVIADRGDFARTDDVAFAPVGHGGDTLAITLFDARRDPDALGEYHVRCEVRAYTDRRARARLVLRDRDTVISDEPMNLEAGERKTHVARGFSSAQAALSARLEDIAIEGAHDALATDDVAWAALAPVLATRVLLVGDANGYLAHALAANPTIALETVAPSAFATRLATLHHAQVVVLDRVAPPAAMTHPAVLAFGALHAPEVRALGSLTAPRITAFASEHRVLAGLRFEQVQIEHAQALATAPDDRVLVRSDRNVLAFARERNGARLVALGFDTTGSDLARRVAFPLFVHNALVWLDRRERAYRAWQPPGEPLRVAGAHAAVRTPDGDTRDVRGTLYDTERVGLYHTADRSVAISAADEAAALPASEGRGDASVRATPGRIALATWVAGAALLLLCAEWMLKTRGRLP